MPFIHVRCRMTQSTSSTFTVSTRGPRDYKLGQFVETPRSEALTAVSTKSTVFRIVDSNTLHGATNVYLKKVSSPSTTQIDTVQNDFPPRSLIRITYEKMQGTTRQTVHSTVSGERGVNSSVDHNRQPSLQSTCMKIPSAIHRKTCLSPENTQLP